MLVCYAQLGFPTRVYAARRLGYFPFGFFDTVFANFPLGLVPQKRPPQVPESFIKCTENTAFWGLVGAFLVNQPKWKFTNCVDFWRGAINMAENIFCYVIPTAYGGGVG